MSVLRCTMERTTSTFEGNWSAVVSWGVHGQKLRAARQKSFIMAKSIVADLMAATMGLMLLTNSARGFMLNAMTLGRTDSPRLGCTPQSILYHGKLASSCFSTSTCKSSSNPITPLGYGNLRKMLVMSALKEGESSRGERTAVAGSPDPGPAWLTEERDACGVGFIVNSQGKAEHKVVKHGLAALGCMEHRGACLADNV